MVTRGTGVDLFGTAGRVVIWITASILIYIALAIVLYVPVFTFGGPVDRDAWTAAFYARVSAAILVHLLVSLVAWLFVARKLEVPQLMTAATLIALFVPLAYFTIGVTLFFEAR